MPLLRRLERLVVFSYLGLHEFVTKIRLLSTGTRRLTDESFIAREARYWVVRCSVCWMCRYEAVQLRAVSVGVRELFVEVDVFFKQDCAIHPVYRQIRVFLQSVQQRFREERIHCVFTDSAYPDRTFAIRLVALLEAAAIKTNARYKKWYYLYRDDRHQ